VFWDVWFHFQWWNKPFFYLLSSFPLCAMLSMCARFHAWRWCITEQSARSHSDCPKHRPTLLQQPRPAVHAVSLSQGASERVFLAAILSLNTHMSLSDNWKSTSCLAASLCRLVVTLSVPSLTCGPGRGGQDGDQGWKLPSSLRRNCTRQAGPALLRTWPRPRGSQAPTRSAPPAPPPRPHQFKTV